ncbi:protein-export chaperone SecB [Cytophagaceae bacterium ABcell3]|nr:protein-export chaperone SecB [Cytophagaceae bacterium ABcell3]
MTKYTAEEQPKIRLKRFNVINIKFNIEEAEWGNRDVFNSSEYSVSFKLLDREKDFFDIVFDITLKGENRAFLLETSFLASFESKGVEVNDKYLESPLIKHNAPAIVFPFIRAFLSTIMLNAGYNPIILPSFNFHSQKEIK